MKTHRAGVGFTKTFFLFGAVVGLRIAGESELDAGKSAINGVVFMKCYHSLVDGYLLECIIELPFVIGVLDVLEIVVSCIPCDDVRISTITLPFSGRCFAVSFEVESCSSVYDDVTCSSVELSVPAGDATFSRDRDLRPYGARDGLP